MTRGLQLDQVEIIHSGTLLVQIDAHVAPGEVLAIMGPSGSGKSTLLAALVGDLDPAFRMSGRVILNGRDITRLAMAERRLGLLFQDDILFPHLSVAGNLGFSLPAGLPRRVRAARIAAALAEAGLEGFEQRDPATLSGGQRSRVALLRTLLAEPHALLLDEPFSRLDTERRAHIRTFVLDRAQAHGLPVVLVTHDPEDARAAGGRILDPLGRARAA